jgi:hypothetical protein
MPECDVRANPNETPINGTSDPLVEYEQDDAWAFNTIDQALAYDALNTIILEEFQPLYSSLTRILKDRQSQTGSITQDTVDDIYSQATSLFLHSSGAARPISKRRKPKANKNRKRKRKSYVYVRTQE